MRYSALFILISVSLLFAEDCLFPVSDCGKRHDSIYQMWVFSRHARVTAQQDPLFKEMDDRAVKHSKGMLKVKFKVCRLPLCTAANFKTLWYYR